MTGTTSGRPLRLLYCTDSYLPQINGVSVVTAMTLEGLQRAGWECQVIAPAYPPAMMPPAHRGSGIAVHAIPSVPWPPYPDLRLSWPARRWIRRRMQAFQPDLVHCPTEFIIGRLALSVARELRLPCCTSYHTDFAQYAEAYGVPWLRRPVDWWIGAMHRRAVRTYAPSRMAAADLQRLGVAHVEIWGRAIDTKAFHPTHRSHALRVRLGCDRAFAFLYVGRLAPEKNVGLLLEAFDQLQASRPTGSVRLLIAGHGPSEAALRKAAGPHVTFLGALDRTTELPALYASADAFVYASTTETLGLVILEAMASGLPVIAVPEGGVADHVRHDDTGAAFAPGDVVGCVRAMERLLGDPAERQRLSVRGRRWAERHGWEEELARLDASYRQLLNA